MYGLVSEHMDRPNHAFIVAEVCRFDGVPAMSHDDTSEYVRHDCMAILASDKTIACITVSELSIVWCGECVGHRCQRRDVAERMNELYVEATRTDTNGNMARTQNSEWVWVPRFSPVDSYRIDWITSLVSHSTVVQSPEYEAHFTYGPRVSAVACKDLMDTRSIYKDLVKRNRTSDPARSRAYDKVQYALKISANSMYGALSFSQYNTYSPRCGMSVTAIGRWCLNVAMTVATCLGFDSYYGDTDSVMFCMPGSRTSYGHPFRVPHQCPIRPYLAQLHRYCTPELVCEYVCGSRGSEQLCPKECSSVRGVVPKIVNAILSYTCANTLELEHQSTGCTTPSGIESCVVSRLLVTARKHYVGLLSDGTTIDKGVSYVRRSGAQLKNECVRRFSMAVMTHSNPTDQVGALTVEYRHLCAMVRDGKSPHTFVVKTTINGVTGSYIKVDHPNVSNVSLNEFSIGTYNIDAEYYMKIIHDVLSNICKCSGLGGSDPVTAGVGRFIWGV